ncbi:hypothetical protein BD413DRAFT_253457 [Trametes elegans]|nr:hypothetical protein BD413DRAFT_253457 [Trametes elegans]
MTNPAEPLIGALLIQLCFAYILYGMTVLQAFYYYQKYSTDKRTLKYLVGAVCFLETAHTGFAMQILCAYLVAGFGNYENLENVTWGVGGTAICGVGVAVCVHGYYTWRIWIVSGNSKLWTLVIGTFALARISFGTGTFVQSYIYPQWALLRNTTSTFVTFIGQSVAAALVDMLVAVCLSLYLTRDRHFWSRDSEGMVNRILLYAVNTGAITGVVSLSCVALFLVPNTGAAFFGMAMIQTKLYSNSLLGSLNARSHMRNKGSQPIRYSSSFGSAGANGLRVAAPRVPIIGIFQQTTAHYDENDGQRNPGDEYALQATDKGGGLAYI